MVLGALTFDRFLLKNPLISEDTKATLDALTAFGTEVRGNSSQLEIHCEELTPALGTIDARNSGTTMRLMTGIASLLQGKTTLTGDESLVRRPMSPLVDALERLGAECSYLGHHGCAPLSVKGPILGSKTLVQGGVSSQFVSALLIACVKKRTSTEIAIEGEMVSRPYVDITIQMLKEFGAKVDEDSISFRMVGDQNLVCEEYSVPGDYSSSAFPLAAAAVSGGDVTVKNLDVRSVQGDRAIIGFLKKFGAEVTVGKEDVRVQGGRLKGTTIDVRQNPDLFPILAVIGSLADGQTVLTGGENLRAKESDRIATTTSFLQAMGARIIPKGDGCEMIGVERLHGASVDTQGDHRILMAAAVAASAASSETRILDDESYSISYPGFLRDMLQIGARMEVRR